MVEGAAVMGGTITAIVGYRDYLRHHLSLCPGKLRFTEHDLQIKLHMLYNTFRPQALCFMDFGNLPTLLLQLGVNFFEAPLGFFRLNYFYSTHNLLSNWINSCCIAFDLSLAYQICNSCSKSSQFLPCGLFFQFINNCCAGIGLGPQVSSSRSLLSKTINFGIDLLPLVRYCSINSGFSSRNTTERAIFSE